MPEEISAIIKTKLSLWFNSLPDQAIDYHNYLVDNFGQTITLAIYLAVAALLLLAVFRSMKFSFDVLRYVIVPTVAVAFIGSLFLPYSFFHIIPFAAIIFSTLLFMKG